MLAELPQVLPVYDNHLVLPFACSRDGDLTWSDVDTGSLGSLTPGDPVNLLYADGSLSPAQLGQLVCLKGECRGDHAALAIEGGSSSKNAVAVVTNVELPSALPFQVRETLDACPGLPPQGIDPEGFDFPQTVPTCTTYHLSGDGRDLTIRIAGHGWMQENGWPIYRYFTQSTIDASADDWTMLSEGTAPLEPKFAWESDDGTMRLLWAREEGIIGPPAFTFREQMIGPNSDRVWISIYEAGGQPCD